MEVENAEIRDLSVGFDHGCLTIWITLMGNGWGCGFGGYRMDPSPSQKPGDSKDVMAFWMKGLCWVLEVDDFLKLQGKHCRAVLAEGTVKKIGHLIKDRWFDPAELQVQISSGKQPEWKES